MDNQILEGLQKLTNEQLIEVGRQMRLGSFEINGEADRERLISILSTGKCDDCDKKIREGRKRNNHVNRMAYTNNGNVSFNLPATLKNADCKECGKKKLTS